MTTVIHKQGGAAQINTFVSTRRGVAHGLWIRCIRRGSRGRVNTALVTCSFPRAAHTNTRVTGSLLGNILSNMNLNAVIERDLETCLLVGSVPGIPGAHTQGETIGEVRSNLAEVIELLQSQDALERDAKGIRK